MINVSRLASAVQNQVLSGLSGYNSTLTIPIAQLEDEVVQEYLVLLKKYSLKGMIPRKELLTDINCIEIDCKPISNCCQDIPINTNTPHFQIPPIVNDFGGGAIEFIGSIDKQLKFEVYTSPIFRFHKYKLRGKNRPYVYLNPAVNSDGLLDGWVFNAPLLEMLSVTAIFKDSRKVQEYIEQHGCCNKLDVETPTWLDAEIIQSLTNKYLKYFRQLQAPNTPNDSIPR